MPATRRPINARPSGHPIRSAVDNLTTPDLQALYGETRTRTGDTTIFSPVLYQRSPPAQVHCRSTSSGAKQRERHDGDPVSAPVGGRPGGDDDAVQELVAKLLLEPGQVPDVAIVDHKFDLHCDDAAVITLEDQIYLLPSPRGAEMTDTRLIALCVHRDREGDETLEQGAEQRTVTREHRVWFPAVQQCVSIDTE
jgi:hypothetical protein